MQLIVKKRKAERLVLVQRAAKYMKEYQSQERHVMILLNFNALLSSSLYSLYSIAVLTMFV